MIVIVDYGMGNLGSISNMFQKVGAKATISSRVEDILAAEKLILPGVGAFDHGMNALADRGLIPPLNNKVLEQKTPCLGICLGMQLLTLSSEEGVAAGLGWVPARTVRFQFNNGENLKIPHMGWNSVRPAPKSRLFFGLESPRFYFVHSYFVQCENAEDIAAEASYGQVFIAAVEHENIFGVQFHPEKSHKHGMALMRNFVNL